MTLPKGAEKSKVHYFTANPNGEAEVVKIILTPELCGPEKRI